MQNAPPRCPLRSEPGDVGRALGIGSGGWVRGCVDAVGARRLGRRRGRPGLLAVLVAVVVLVPVDAPQHPCQPLCAWQRSSSSSHGPSPSQRRPWPHACVLATDERVAEALAPPLPPPPSTERGHEHSAPTAPTAPLARSLRRRRAAQCARWGPLSAVAAAALGPAWTLDAGRWTLDRGGGRAGTLRPKANGVIRSSHRSPAIPWVSILVAVACDLWLRPCGLPPAVGVRACIHRTAQRSAVQARQRQNAAAAACLLACLLAASSAAFACSRCFYCSADESMGSTPTHPPIHPPQSPAPLPLPLPHGIFQIAPSSSRRAACGALPAS